MIRKQDILDRAAEWRLRPEVVEKDYVLGWLLAALASTPVGTAWIFKGGTSIKKCYFETYRFSEDLDFSLLIEAPYSEEAIREVLSALARKAYDLSGVQFPEDGIQLRLRQNRQGQPTYEGRLSYIGPLVYPGPPRVLFDITQHEPVLDQPSARPVFHPYPDSLPEGTEVRTYSFNELLAEKTRALYERSRPRDLYDVVFLLENRPDAFDLAVVRDLFGRKCSGKGLPTPSATRLLEIVVGNEELRSEWVNMLGHQLPTLPNLDDLLGRLPGLLAWIDRPEAALPAAALAAAPVPADTVQIAPAGIQYWGGGLPLETVRFAGANHLMIEFGYDGKHRIAEPYSLRRARTGNILLFAWEQGSSHIKAFNVAKMTSVRATSHGFTPRYRVEFSSGSPVSIPDSPDPPIRAGWPSLKSTRPSRAARNRLGPNYVFECPYCQKQFRRGTNDPSLRRHKMKDGYVDCPGRQGYLVEVR